MSDLSGLVVFFFEKETHTTARELNEMKGRVENGG